MDIPRMFIDGLPAMEAATMAERSRSNVESATRSALGSVRNFDRVCSLAAENAHQSSTDGLRRWNEEQVALNNPYSTVDSILEAERERKAAVDAMCQPLSTLVTIEDNVRQWHEEQAALTRESYSAVDSILEAERERKAAMDAMSQPLSAWETIGDHVRQWHEEQAALTRDSTAENPETAQKLASSNAGSQSASPEQEEEGLRDDPEILAECRACMIETISLTLLHDQLPDWLVSRESLAFDIAVDSFGFLTAMSSCGHYGRSRPGNLPPTSMRLVDCTSTPRRHRLD